MNLLELTKRTVKHYAQYCSEFSSPSNLTTCSIEEDSLEAQIFELALLVAYQEHIEQKAPRTTPLSWQTQVDQYILVQQRRDLEARADQPHQQRWIKLFPFWQPEVRRQNLLPKRGILKQQMTQKGL